jgi:hypothetical protein
MIYVIKLPSLFMKMKIIVVLLLYYNSSTSQNLENAEWIQIKAERKDSSRLLSRFGDYVPNIKFFFKDNTAYFLQSNNLSQKTDYKIVDNILYLGKFSQFMIEKNNALFLTLCQFSTNKNLADDKLNRYYFVKSNSLFSYLIENNLIPKLTNDTICDNAFLYPSYYGDVGNSFTEIFENPNREKEITGSFFINSKNEISNIEIRAINGKISKNETINITSVIQGTSKGWSIPYTNKPLVFCVDFTFKLEQMNTVYVYNFSFGKNSKKNNSTKFSITQKSDAERYFNSGNESLIKENFNDAIKQYSSCLRNDSLFLDAYYNIAYCYQKIDNWEMACKTWEILKQMGQKKGEYLLAEYCK